jgi:hypothetical protein
VRHGTAKPQTEEVMNEAARLAAIGGIAIAAATDFPHGQ